MGLTSNFGDWDFARFVLTGNDWEEVEFPAWCRSAEIVNPSASPDILWVGRAQSGAWAATHDQFPIAAGGSLLISFYSEMFAVGPLTRKVSIRMSGGAGINLYAYLRGDR